MANQRSISERFAKGNQRAQKSSSSHEAARDLLASRLRIHGVDFSGARDAARKIWIATGTLVSDGLRIEDCRRTVSLPGGRGNRESSLAALGQFIVADSQNVVGLDFPFGLPKTVVQELFGSDAWEDYVRRIPVDYPTPENLKDACARAGKGRELRRVTDRECHAPFSPYNLRLYRQTFYGISQLIAPLVGQNAISVLPMQQPHPQRPWLLEVCPASTLKRNGLNESYKSRSRGALCARRHILETIREMYGVSFAGPRLEQEVLQDHQGDALDSIVAVSAVAAALRNPPNLDDEAYDLEGYIFV